MEKKLIITIDGPAGAGKTTVATILAKRLGLPLLSSGSLYRTVAFLALEKGIDPEDEEGCAALVKTSEIEVVGPSQVKVGKRVLSQELRTREVTAASSKVGALESVHQLLREPMLEFAAKGGCITEGRDQGTYVFPEAALKIFLTAAESVRYQRTVQTQGEEVASHNSERDQRESSRPFSPMTKAPDAVTIDSTRLTIEEVVAAILDLLKERKLYTDSH